MNTTNDVTVTEACPMTAFVITLGKQLLQEKVKDWLDMDSTARFCKDHGIQLDGKHLGSMELETTLRSFFHRTFAVDGQEIDF